MLFATLLLCASSVSWALAGGACLYWWLLTQRLRYAIMLAGSIALMVSFARWAAIFWAMT